MRILIDADACPVIKNTIDIASEYQIEVHLFYDDSHFFESNCTINHICSKGPNSVDFEIIQFTLENDIIITQDYGLASLALSKKALVINQNGIIFNEENIELFLNQRYLSFMLRKQTKHIKGPKKRINENDKKFEKSLVSIIRKAKNNIKEKK